MTFQESFVKIRFSFRPEKALFSPSCNLCEPEAAIPSVNLRNHLFGVSLVCLLMMPLFL